MPFNDKEQQVIQWGLKNGKSSQEVKDAIFRLRTTGSPIDPTKAPIEKVLPTDSWEAKYKASALGHEPIIEAPLGERVQSTIQQTGAKVSELISGQNPEDADKTPIRRGTEVAAEVSGGTIATIFQTLPPEARKGLGEIGEGFNKAIDFLGGKLAEIPAYKQWQEENPQAVRALTDVAGTLAASGRIADAILVVEGGLKSAERLRKTASTAVETVKGAIPKELPSISAKLPSVDDAFNSAKQLRTKVQEYVGEKTVSPKLKASAERLSTENPVEQYNRDIAQAKKSLVDEKIDDPLSQLGSEVGDKFREVVQQRRDVGKVMGEELKKVGKTKLDTTDAFTNLETLLKDSGATYDAVKGKIKLSDTAKFAPQDVPLIEKYVKELNKIGANPTLAQVDGLLGRMNQIIEYDKSAKGIMSVTNGERIIKQSLNDLRTAIDASSDARLTAYKDARATYSELSNFVDEGASFLGKITQSGDFAKDASLLKSSVQSILNSGKKDWLLRLEGLTGYNAIDKAVIALQAMKDTGIVKGESLLQMLSQGSIPTSKAGFTAKLIDFVAQGLGKVAAGSPEEQTRAFLQSLGRSPQ